MTLTRAFHDQAVSCAALGSPFMARLMSLCAERLTPDHGPVAARLHAWPGDASSRGASLPLRLAGGLHALRLRGDGRLAVVYPPHEASDADLWRAVSEAIEVEVPFLLDWILRPPQTNEVRRAAVFRAAGQWLAARQGLPLEVLELGASAGLNLHWDRFALRIGRRVHAPSDPVLTLAPDWSGFPPPDAKPRVVRRKGVDLTPLDPVADRLRLLAYLWPDQPERRLLTEAALSLPPATVDAGDAADWLETLPPQAPGTCRLIQHSVAWQYFPPAVQARASATIARLGGVATPEAPVAHLAMEADGGARGAGVTLAVWPDERVLDAGRADFHGRWVDWRLPPLDRSDPSSGLDAGGRP
jgi:hypothetical protein